MRWLQLGVLAEIVDRSGIVRQTAGCSIIGRREFSLRLERIQQILATAEDDQPWYDLFHSNAEFSHAIERCLALNSLSLDWFTPAQIEALLFPRVENGQVEQGHLIQLNSPPPSGNQSSKGEKPQTIEEVIACLSEDLEQAMVMATEVPADVAIAINQAQASMRLSPEERAEAEQRKNRPDPKEIQKLLLG